MRDVNSLSQVYLKATAYPTSASTDFTSNLSRWMKDSAQSGASTQSKTRRWKNLLANAKTA